MERSLRKADRSVCADPGLRVGGSALAVTVTSGPHGEGPRKEGVALQLGVGSQGPARRAALTGLAMVLPPRVCPLCMGRVPASSQATGASAGWPWTWLATVASAVCPEFQTTDKPVTFRSCAVGGWPGRVQGGFTEPFCCALGGWGGGGS